MQGLSERQYAARVGLSRGAIQKAKDAGRLVLFADGSIDAEASDTRRTETTDPSKSRAAPKSPATGKAKLKPVPEAAVSAVGDTLKEQGMAAPAVGGSTTFLQAKTANEVLKAQERRIRLQKLKGDLVDKARAETLIFRLAREERDAWVTWPARVAALMASELAAALGDPVSLAEARSLTFAHRRKALLISTPTIRGLSRIEREFEASDQRRYHVPCPHCGHVQWLRFERLRWDKGQPDTAEYHCEGCDAAIAEHHKTAMLAAGEWRALATSADPHTVGYHLSALYSPIGWLSWARIARAWEAAQGNDEAMRAFRNTILGETWFETGEAPNWQRLAERREAWTPGTVPAGGLFLTAGVDVQKDRIEVDVWAWGRGLESWLVDHIVIEGGPGDPDCWQRLTDLLGKVWAHESGQHLTIAKLAIDTGYETSAVYAWARQVGFAQVAPVKGLEGFNRSSPVTGPTYVDATIGGKRLRRGARLWTVATSTFKAETYRFLRQDRPTMEEIAAVAVFPPGSVHLPTWADGEWLKQLTAEQLITVKGKRGFTKLEWQKLRERNEALDCRVYARAAAWIAGADRWSEARWQELERQLAVETRVAAQEATNATPPRPSARRRTVRSSYMG